MTIETVRLTMTGVRPLLMHNGQLADKTNEVMKQIRAITNKPSSKRTDEDDLELYRLEWIGGLYRDPENRVAITEDMVLGALIEGAKLSRHGKLAKAGVLCTDPWFPLKYDGPKDLEKLYEDPRFTDRRRVVVQRNAIMRTRPRFNEWSVEVGLLVDTEVMNVQTAVDALAVAGRREGLGDFRPRFGRFKVNGL